MILGVLSMLFLFWEIDQSLTHPPFVENSLINFSPQFLLSLMFCSWVMIIQWSTRSSPGLLSWWRRSWTSRVISLSRTSSSSTWDILVLSKRGAWVEEEKRGRGTSCSRICWGCQEKEAWGWNYKAKWETKKSRIEDDIDPARTTMNSHDGVLS